MKLRNKDVGFCSVWRFGQQHGCSVRSILAWECARCLVPGCVDHSQVRGMCPAHYERTKRAVASGRTTWDAQVAAGASASVVMDDGLTVVRDFARSGAMEHREWTVTQTEAGNGPLAARLVFAVAHPQGVVCPYFLSRTLGVSLYACREMLTNLQASGFVGGVPLRPTAGLLSALCDEEYGAMNYMLIQMCALGWVECKHELEAA